MAQIKLHMKMAKLVRVDGSATPGISLMLIPGNLPCKIPVKFVRMSDLDSNAAEDTDILFVFLLIYLAKLQDYQAVT